MLLVVRAGAEDLARPVRREDIGIVQYDEYKIRLLKRRGLQPRS